MAEQVDAYAPQNSFIFSPARCTPGTPTQPDQQIIADNCTLPKRGPLYLTAWHGRPLELVLNPPDYAAGDIPGSDDENLDLFIISTDALAHVITTATNGFRGNASQITFDTAPGGAAWLIAHHGVWWDVGSIGVEFA